MALVLHAFDTVNTVDEKGYYRVTTSVLVTLGFDDVRESEVRDLGSQNVLSSLEFELDLSGLVRVTPGLFSMGFCQQERYNRALSSL